MTATIQLTEDMVIKASRLQVNPIRKFPALGAPEAVAFVLQMFHNGKLSKDQVNHLNGWLDSEALNLS